MAVLKTDNVCVREGGSLILDKLSFCFEDGEQWAITGASGSGKTTLLRTLAGRHAHTGTITVNAGGAKQRKMVLVEQQHRFRNLSNTNTFYYQQRYNSSDSEDAATVEDELQHYLPANESGKSIHAAGVSQILELLHLKGLLTEKLIQLSNGENKRLQIAKALLLDPAILLLDSPFTGLDVEARETLVTLLDRIRLNGIHVVIVCAPGQIPAFITHVLHLEKGGKYSLSKVADFRQAQKASSTKPVFTPDEGLFKELTAADDSLNFDFAVKMNGVNIRYNDRAILDNINWQVLKGERWCLSGPNGAGKSTLLSLVNADNPQAYANQVYVFDRRRGTGETIWDIKKRIGFISPELHLYFDTSSSCFDVVASGLFDTIGLFRALSPQQQDLVRKWMRLLTIEHLSNHLLFRLSNSQQRLVLLARALVKNPPMLILDEPGQGLDEDQVAAFKAIVNEICVRSNKTLIYVSHYTHEIPECVNKFIRLENGRVVSLESR